MNLMGIRDYRTYHKAIALHEPDIGEPVNGTYTVAQVVKLITHYEYLFTEPFDLMEEAVKYRKHLESVEYIKNSLYPLVNKAI